MTVPATGTSTQPRRLGRSIAAVVLGIPYNVLGCYIIAKLAPHAPMGHVWVGGTIGLVLSAAGAIAAIRMHLGPAWYPIALALTALPCAWLGGTLHRRWHAEQARTLVST